MLETFTTMDTMLQTYWVLAICASLVFVVQAVMTIVGFDSDADFGGGDMDFDADGFHIISVKTIICFILGFGWTGVLFYHDIENSVLLGLMATAVGLIFMFLIALILRQIMKLNRDNTFRVDQTVGKVAEVYLRIPAGKTDTGKIVVSVNGSMHELEALSEGEEIATGAKVKVTKVIDNDVVAVERI